MAMVQIKPVFLFNLYQPLGIPNIFPINSLSDIDLQRISLSLPRGSYMKSHYPIEWDVLNRFNVYQDVHFYRKRTEAYSL